MRKDFMGGYVLLEIMHDILEIMYDMMASLAGGHVLQEYM